MAKLDPDNAKSAKDIMDERAAAAALKRKREEEGGSDNDGPTEKQREGLKLHDRKDKRRKTDKKEPNAVTPGDKAETTVDDQKRRKAEKKAAKKQKAQAKKQKAQQKIERKKAEKRAALSNEPLDPINNSPDESEDGEDDLEMVDAIDIVGKNTTTIDDGHSTASPSPEIASPLHSPPLHSGSSSISSILPISISPVDKLAIPKPTLSNPTPSSTPVDPSLLTPQQRLEARISALRAARKADGPDGRPPRNRQELLESRRRKEEERRAHKKELRRKAKVEEIRKQEEEIAKRFSPGGSGSLIASPRSPMEPANTFSFGRVAFGDGTQVDSSLSSLLDPHKRKGPSDANTALKAAQNKASRLSGLDEAKRADIQQKDLWLNAKKKAHGERVKDDTSLLKKALKRQEDSKKKSEKEWQGRIEGVAKSQEMKQKRREQNLFKRRDEKGGGGKKKKGGAAAGKKAKVKRPGFEGSFKTKPGKTGKK
jgi:hypothetical protein